MHEKTTGICQEKPLGWRHREPQIIDSYELSPFQAGMLFHSLSQPNSGIYIEQVIITLGKSVDPDAIAAVWREIVERHPVMRTSFRWEGTPQPMQDVWDHGELPVEYLYWRDLAPDEYKNRLSTFLSADRKRGFDLSVAPVMRLTLVLSGHETLTIVWTSHHILLDGWSSPKVLRELFDLYETRLRGSTVSLPLPKTAYRAHVEWLRDLDITHAESYWRNALRGFHAPTILWVERSKNDGPGERLGFGAFGIEVPSEQTEALKTAASAAGVTVNTMLQGGWAILLSRLSGTRDIVFGATRACRRSSVSGADEIIGPLINTLPVRVDVDPDAELGPWLRTIRAQSLAVREFEHTPLVKVQSWSDVPQGRLLFENILVYDHMTLDAHLRALGGNWQYRKFQHIGQTNYPLALIACGGTKLLLRVEYSRQRFEDSVAQRLLHYLKNLLDQIAVSAQCRRLATLTLLPSEERHELISLARPVASWSPSVTLHAHLEEQAGRHGDRIAVACEEQTLTYAELNARANRVAHRLRELGARPDDFVGLCTERGLNMIVGMLAILKSGAAYLPLEPAYPEQRIAFMLKDAHVRIAVTEHSLADQLAGAGVNCLLLDTPIEAPEHNPEPTAGPDNLAYAIYTSGSTGTPKGVLITHANVTRLFESTNAWFGFGPEDVWTSFHSYAFDFSVWEVWGALLYGGRLIIVPYWVSRDPSAFRKLLLEQRVSVLNQTPSAFRQLVQADLAESPSPGDYALRYVIFGGETLELHRLRPWFERYGDQRPQLVNMYGITETTVHVTYRPISLTDVESGQGSVIGVPVPDLYVHLLDAQGEPVPVGVPGEIYIGGAGVARGYLNRPELTAQRFITDPFDSSAKARVYRSGDLARRLANGDIEFLGRIDQQVKIRGFRIELGEIEAAIARSSRVADVAVIAREDIPGEKCLVAYLVANGSSTGIIEEVRKALNSQLPDYMLPAHFILLDALPLNSNGKLDRNALPAPHAGGGLQSKTKRPFVAPRTETEHTIAGIWTEVLQLERIGVTEHFFELGGDSMQMMQVVSRCRRVGLHLTARDFSEAPTVEALVKRLDEDAQAARPALRTVLHPAEIPLSFAQPRAVVPLQPRGTRPPIFGVGGPGDSGFCYQALSQVLGTDQPFYGLEPPGLDDATPPLQEVADLADYFSAAIREFHPNGPILIAGYCAGGTVAFELARRLLAQGSNVALLILLASPYPTAYRLAARLKQNLKLIALVIRSLATAAGRLQYLQYVASRVRYHLGRRSRDALAAAKDPVGARVKMVEAAIVDAVRRYQPEHFEGRMALIVTNESYKDHSDRPLEWQRHARAVDVFTGPTLCHHDTILSDFAPVTARLIEKAWAAASAAYTTTSAAEKP
jgi:amino acid adenylation domain-containing protein